MKTFVPCFEILPKAQKALWYRLSPCQDFGFVLYGGTGIALQLGHRSSVDFDFFSHFPLNEIKEKELLAALPFLDKAERVQFAPNTRSYITETNVKFLYNELKSAEGDTECHV
jgi:hypothetical protein